ncbi:MAG: respiratory nitrate reductase subunit gamma [Planctomycetota bacterium]
MPGFLLLTITYGSVGVFILAVLWRAVRISRLPVHLRWELYPVAHEKGRASYGGSYLEESDWWTKPRESSLAGELKVMIPEIVLLAGVWEHNRKHWLRTFPFHFGLYLLAGLLVLLLVGGIAMAAGATVSVEAVGIAALLYHATYIVGYAGMVLGLIGAASLLGRRLFNPDYREYTKKADHFNLFFFILTFTVALLAHAATDPYFTDLRTYFAELVTLGGFTETVEAPHAFGFLTAVEIVLVSLLLAYIPLTHMSHFFTKWFMYHDIRWSDEPNLRGGKIERQVNEMLHYPVSWAAPHIRGDGKKTWADVATAGVEEKDE